MSNPKLSVIICSINPDLCKSTVKNFNETAGIDLEFHVIDNRLSNRPIAQVYNDGGRQSEAPYLLFIHEDVAFKSNDWGKILTDKLSEPDCGVIGFAGGSAWVPSPGAWNDVCDSNRIYNFTDCDNGISRKFIKPINNTEEFLPVVSLDGVALAVRKDVWEKYPFDEKVLRGFHCYDIDFSVEIARHYKNYVCYCITLAHFSGGSYNNTWLKIAESVYNEKWSKCGPVFAEGSNPADLNKIADNLDFKLAFRKIRMGCDNRTAIKYIQEYRKSSPFKCNRIKMKHTFTLLYQHLIKNVLRPKA